MKASHSETEKSAQVEKISKELGLCAPTVHLLLNRGCTDPKSCVDFLEKRAEQLHDPFLMKDMVKAARHILEVARAKKRIVIYGDYDGDGVTSVSILYMYLESIGADV